MTPNEMLLEVYEAEAKSLRRKLRLPTTAEWMQRRGAAYPTPERQTNRRKRLDDLERRLIPVCAVDAMREVHLYA